MQQPTNLTPQHTVVHITPQFAGSLPRILCGIAGNVAQMRRLLDAGQVVDAAVPGAHLAETAKAHGFDVLGSLAEHFEAAARHAAHAEAYRCLLQIEAFLDRLQVVTDS